MRAIYVMALIFVTAPAVAESPRAVVFAQECKQVNAKEIGFECRFDPNKGAQTGGASMQIFWREKTSSMSAQRQEKAKAEFSRIALRYIELGGMHFTVRFAHWAPDKMRSCWKKKNVPYADFYCVDG